MSGHEKGIFYQEWAGAFDSKADCRYIGNPFATVTAFFPEAIINHSTMITNAHDFFQVFRWHEGRLRSAESSNMRFRQFGERVIVDVET